MLLRRMMVLMGVMVIAAPAGLAFAANPDTGPGCGLGKLAFQDFKNQKNIAPQVLMATTNGTFGSTTFETWCAVRIRGVEATYMPERMRHTRSTSARRSTS